MPAAAIAGGLIGLAGNLVGAGESRNANLMNYYINLMNYNQREAERWQTISEARRKDDEAKLGSTDAQGNRTHFVPGVGWVVDLSDEQKTLRELYNREEMQQLNNDLPKKRQILNDNVSRQGRESTVAQQLLDAFQRVRRVNPVDLENQLNNASTRGITQGFDSALADAMQASVRTGASNSGKVAAEIAKARGKALEDAFMSNKINSKTQSRSQYDAERSNAANLYNMFASRASAMPDVAYNPRNIEGVTDAAQGRAMGIGSGAGSALINAFAKQGGTLQPVQADYGLANAITAGGTTLANAFDVRNTDRARLAALDQYGDYSDPHQYKKSTGGW